MAPDFPVESRSHESFVVLVTTLAVSLPNWNGKLYYVIGVGLGAPWNYSIFF